VSELPWNPQQDWRQLGGQPPYQGGPYRGPDDEPPGPDPDDDGQGPPPVRRDRHTVRNVLAGIGVLAIAGLVLSAVSSKGTGTSPGAARTSAPAVAARSLGPQPTAAVRTGATLAQPTEPGVIGSYFNLQDGSGNTYQVTLARVVDPGKSADQLATIPRGNRLVGIVFNITALDGNPQGPQGEDADNDCKVLGSDGKVYTAVFDRITGYSNFEVGVVRVPQGATVQGAVTFELPQYIKVVKVLWYGSDGFGSAVWWYANT
jgi:hypothetical protein